MKIKNWWIPLLKGIVLIVLSFLIFFNPVATVMGLSFYIGIALLFAGVFALFTAISLRSKIRGWGWRLAEGLMDIFFGFILLAHPGLTALLVSFMLGFWFLFYGITSLTDSFARKDEGQSNWWVRLIWGVLAVVFAFWIMFKPFAGAVTIVTLLGTFFMLAGIFNIAFSFILKGLKQRIEN